MKSVQQLEKQIKEAEDLIASIGDVDYVYDGNIYMEAPNQGVKTILLEGCSHQQIKPHTCPYKEDVNSDNETLCTCCDTCTHECAMDI